MKLHVLLSCAFRDSNTILMRTGALKSRAEYNTSAGAEGEANIPVTENKAEHNVQYTIDVKPGTINST